MKLFLIFLILLTFLIETKSQKVANYSYGDPGKEDFEEFSFWVKENKVAEIEYTYGADWKTVTLKYIGIDVLNGEDCFKVKFSNDYILYVIPKETRLKISDFKGNYLKYFYWYYEGPVNGIGTFCEPCAENENEAMTIIKSYYMK